MVSVFKSEREMIVSAPDTIYLSVDGVMTPYAVRPGARSGKMMLQNLYTNKVEQILPAWETIVYYVPDYDAMLALMSNS